MVCRAPSPNRELDESAKTTASEGTVMTTERTVVDSFEDEYVDEYEDEFFDDDALDGPDAIRDTSGNELKKQKRF